VTFEGGPTGRMWWFGSKGCRWSTAAAVADSVIILFVVYCNKEKGN
jgi:hypothetical protein